MGIVAVAIAFAIVGAALVAGVEAVVMTRETEQEIRALREISPLKIQPPIMYWRPQKVGTSTIFSLLLSYSFRYNLLVRRKGAKNTFCIRVVQCGANALSVDSRDNSGMSSALKKKIDNYHKPLSNRERNAETLLEQNWFSIVGTHNLCNVPGKYVQAGLSCAFRNDLSFLSGSPFRSDGDSPQFEFKELFESSPFMSQLLHIDRVYELFSVREPVSRMISAYYFWGELGKMKMMGSKSLGSVEATAKQRSSAKVRRGTGNHSDVDEELRVSASWSSRTVSSLRSAFSPNANAKAKQQQQQQKQLEQQRQTLAAQDSSNNSDVDVDSSAALTAAVRAHSTASTDQSRRRLIYHGDERTVPPTATAKAFASNLPIGPGKFSGPGSTWSLFADSVSEAVEIMKTDRIMTLVLERLDESLVVVSRYLKWSLADVVVASSRKSQSSHPGPTEWPQAITEQIRQQLIEHGEYSVYDTANVKLNERIKSLEMNGAPTLTRDGMIDSSISSSNFEIAVEVELLRQIRARVSQVCFESRSLARYRSYLKNSHRLLPNRSNNKLRDVASQFIEEGHEFSWNGHIFFSFDLCSGCESHAILFGLTHSLAKDVNSSTLLEDLTPQQRSGQVQFQKCPVFDK